MNTSAKHFGLVVGP